VRPWNGAHHVLDFDYLLEVDDNQFLHSCSTSPLVERSTFVSEFRASIQYAMDHQADLFENMGPRYFSWNEARGGWHEMDATTL